MSNDGGGAGTGTGSGGAGTGPPLHLRIAHGEQIAAVVMGISVIVGMFAGLHQAWLIAVGAGVVFATASAYVHRRHRWRI